MAQNTKYGECALSISRLERILYKLSIKIENAKSSAEVVTYYYALAKEFEGYARAATELADKNCKMSVKDVIEEIS